MPTFSLAQSLVLRGCASFSPDGGFLADQQTAQTRLDKRLICARTETDQDSIAQRVAELLAQPGKTFVYEFVARRPGTFMYHPHADEMVQMAMGMMGCWITHPKQKHPLISDVDRDFVFLLNAYDITPGSDTPSIMPMVFAVKDRALPDRLKTGDKVKFKAVNDGGQLTVTEIAPAAR